MSKLRDCHDHIETILGKDTEPFESAKLVEEYRRYWKPDIVKIILLAESHLYTSIEDMSITLPEIPQLDMPSNYPRNYARFVYCLSHGERELTQNSSHPKGVGTPSFWKIFYSCCNDVLTIGDFKPILKRIPFEERLANKICVLKNLKSKGVWLVDASIVALYKKGEKPKQSMMNAVIDASWEYYISDVVSNAKPNHVIIIGKGVAHRLESKLIRMNTQYEIIPQPGGVRSFNDYLPYYKLLYNRCHE